MKLWLRMIIVLAVISSLSGIILAGIDSWTASLKAAHAEEAVKRAIMEIVPGVATYELVANRGPKNHPVYRCLDAAGAPIGYAFVAEGSGFQGAIKIMAGLKPDRVTLTGIKILGQIETPGLGAEIVRINQEATGPENYLFRNWFVGLTADPAIELVKNELPSRPNQVQSITGATISARAVVDILNAALDEVRELTMEEIPVTPLPRVTPAEEDAPIEGETAS